MGHVTAETDQSKVESTATGINRGHRGEERASSKSNEIAGGDQHLRDGDYAAQKGQVARKEAQLVQLERQKHSQHTGVGTEHGQQTAEREITRERRPEARATEGQQPRRRAALQLRQLERLVRKRKGQHRQ